MKTCTKCGSEIEDALFYKDSSKRDGLRPICKPCTNLQQKNAKSDPEKRNKRKHDQTKYASTAKTKTCIKCNIEKTLSEFYSGLPTKDGLDTKCKECTLKCRREHREKNREKINHRKRIDWVKNKDIYNSKKKLTRIQNKEIILKNGAEKYKNSVSRICSRCGEEKPKIEFFIKYDASDGLCPHCKVCEAERCKKYRLQHQEELKLYSQQYYSENAHELNLKAKIYVHKNKDKLNSASRIRNRIRRVEDPTYKLSTNIRNRVYCLIIKRSSGIKSKSTLELLGCTIDEVRLHLESQFQEGMTWDNHGVHGWHIDHIRPCASFDLTDPEQQKQCFHYTNLQPLWAIDNIRKGCKIIE